VFSIVPYEEFFGKLNGLKRFSLILGRARRDPRTQTNLRLEELLARVPVRVNVAGGFFA
jgi:hypothetical protein